MSVFNRWGWKAYPKEYDADPLKKGPGPDKGTSLALMKKLMYEQIFYNSVAVGFESSCYWNGDQLSPVGRIQQGAVDWSAGTATSSAPSGASSRAPWTGLRGTAIQA